LPSSRSSKAAASWFSEAAQAAGVERTAHGLRKRRAERIAEAGGTTAQIQAWLGHESPVESHRYAKRAERKRVLTGTD
jgi:integrase